MTRGQAERLFPLLEEILGEHGAVWAELDAIGVGVGPGNFTGTRLSVSAARGLALSLGVPAIGLSAFDVVRALLDGNAGQVITLLPAPRDGVYWELAKDGLKVRNGMAMRSEFVCHGYLEGHGTIKVADPLPAYEVYHVDGVGIDCDAPAHALSDFSEKVAPSLATLAAKRVLATTDHASPAPLYIRPADAAPPSDPPPVILP